MRSTSGSAPDLDDVRARFETWRARGPRQTIPDELWLAAASLLDRYTAHTICTTLRLNEARFRAKRRELGAAQPPRSSSPRRSARPLAAGSAASTSTRSALARSDFVELALAASPDPRTAAERAAASCSLLIERPDGSRFQIDGLAPDSDALLALATGFLARSCASPRRRP